MDVDLFFVSCGERVGVALALVKMAIPTGVMQATMVDRWVGDLPKTFE